MLSEQARMARNAYQREYRKRYFEAHPEAKEKKLEYTRQWRKRNADKQRKYVEDYWERKAAESAAEKGFAD